MGFYAGVFEEPKRAERRKAKKRPTGRVGDRLRYIFNIWSFHRNFSTALLQFLHIFMSSSWRPLGLPSFPSCQALRTTRPWTNMLHHCSIGLSLSLTQIVRVFCIYCSPIVDKIYDHAVAFVVRESFRLYRHFHDIHIYLGFDGLRPRPHAR